MCGGGGGYAYLIDTSDPLRSTHIGLKPVAEVRVFAEFGLLVFVGFHSMVDWGRDGLAWETKRLSWEGLKLGEVVDGVLHGLGWNLNDAIRRWGLRWICGRGVCVGGAF